MKKSKILVPALGILVLSTAASITGTVAWFTASNFVEVSGFTMQAKAEEGIVIANETHSADANWKITATASHNGQVSGASGDEQAAFVPTSSANLATWYHANASEANSAAAIASTYVTKTPSEVSGTGVYQMDISTTSSVNNQNIYLLNKFYIQSSSKSDLVNYDLYLQDLEVQVNEGTSESVSTELNKSFRIGVGYRVYGASAYGDFTVSKIFAPFAGATLTYTVGGTGGTSVTAIAGSATVDPAKVNLLEGVTIPAYTTAGTKAIELSFFAYFEGEDAACKSANITASMDTLAVSFKLGNAEHTGA